MAEVRMVIALMNKEGWDPSGDTSLWPKRYRPLRLLGGLSTREPFPIFSKTVEDIDFDDKFIVYNNSIYDYVETLYPEDDPKAKWNVELLCKPVSRGEFHGVLVLVLQKNSRKDVTDVRVVGASDLWDVEQDEVRQKIPSKLKVLEARTLPKVPEDTGADIREATIQPPVSEPLTPEEREARFEADFDAFIGDHPERGELLAIRIWKKAEEALPPEQRHSLGLREAARRISETRGISLDHSQLRNYFRDPEVNIGTEGPRGEPLFSPAECDAFIPPLPKKRGPKPKTSSNSGEGT